MADKKMVTNPPADPQVAITIAVDTDYVFGVLSNNGTVTNGIYMVDNHVLEGSSNEGQMNLSTSCHTGNFVGFNIVPIDTLADAGDSVLITGFDTSKGNVFTAAGTPTQQTSPGSEPAGSYWVGQALKSGTQTYTINGSITLGGVTQFFQWDPSITAN